MIETRALVKTYPGRSSPVLKALNLSVSPGDVLWVSGESGAGKSTLLNVLGVLTPADAGSYRLDGREMRGASQRDKEAARRHLVSMVFQRGNLFDHVTTLDNVTLGMPEPDREAAMRHLDFVGMGDRATQLAGLLSGGEQRRVALARAAARRTPVLLADEPAAGLDAPHVTGVLRLLAEAAERGVAVVVVSHDDRTADIATDRLDLDRVAP